MRPLSEREPSGANVPAIAAQRSGASPSAVSRSENGRTIYLCPCGATFDYLSLLCIHEIEACVERKGTPELETPPSLARADSLSLGAHRVPMLEPTDET